MGTRARIFDRRLAGLVALWAIWLQAILPPGFMPGVTPGGAAGLVICSGGLPAHLAAALPGAGGDPAAEAFHNDGACVFAAAAALPPTVVSTPLPSVAEISGPARIAYLAPPVLKPGPPLGSRAPPVSIFA